MRVLIVGCGYVGVAVGSELVKQGHELFGVCRTGSGQVALKAAGIHPCIADITRPQDLPALPGPFDWVVNTVASMKGEVEDYRQVYLEGMRNLIAWLATRPPTKLVYTSSTSVYGQVDGSWVEETSATEPASETSRVLLETERVLLEAVPALPAVVLRVAGIYGPERGYWLRQYLKGEATMTGGGEHILNMIHREDVAGIIIAALERGSPGAIYNACDDEPVAQIGLFRWLSRTLGRPMPPVAVEPQDVARKRGVTDKRVSNLKLKQALSYQFRYPSFREGFTEEIRRIGLR